MSKIIIHVPDDLSDYQAVAMVKKVIKGGLVSTSPGRSQYWFNTTFESLSTGQVFTVFADSTRKGLHTFRINSDRPQKVLENNQQIGDYSNERIFTSS